LNRCVLRHSTINSKRRKVGEYLKLQEVASGYVARKDIVFFENGANIIPTLSPTVDNSNTVLFL